ncbi:MAG: nucleoside triphosphate pyrophosphohydrolase [Candidatus Saccharibacteria bacterium]|nr:nucleoside triphosphate pyrophosphohydrolase [Candidatus Saccharibacteria bacterium]
MAEKYIRFYWGSDGKGKLVRGNIVKNIDFEGHYVDWRKLDDRELPLAILNKLSEEMAEVIEAVQSGDRDEEIEEVADLLAIVESYAQVRGLDMAEINRAKDTKTAKRGSLADGVWVNYCDLLPAGDKYDYWLNYFRSRPNGYIEEK